MRYLLVLFLLTACTTPLSQPVWPASSSKAKLTQGHFYTADGTALPLKQWVPKEKPKAVILALHGFNDYSHAFEGTGAFFESHGIAVYAYDQRGFGAAPMTGIWADEKNLTGDAKQCIQLLKQRYPRTPLYVLGESMGGAVALETLADSSTSQVDGAILIAPAVWGDSVTSPFLRGMLWALAHTIPAYTFTGEDLKILASDNIPMLRAMYDDPLVIKETRADAVYGLVDLMGNGYLMASQAKIPALILHGDQDQVIPRAPVAETVLNYAGPVQVIYYPKGYHMLLRDLQAKKVQEDILTWTRSNKL